MSEMSNKGNEPAPLTVKEDLKVFVIITLPIFIVAFLSLALVITLGAH